MIFHYFRVFCWINLRLEIEHFSSVSLTRKVWEYVSHASDRLNIGIYIASQTSLRPHQVKSGRFVRVYIVVFIPCSLSSAHQVKSGRFVKIYIMVFIPCPYSRLTKIHARPSRIFWLLKKTRFLFDDNLLKQLHVHHFSVVKFYRWNFENNEN